MSETTQPAERSGLLSGGNWIIDQVKIIDVYPKHEQLANIYSQSQGTGGSPYNVLLDLAKMGAKFPLEGAWSCRAGQPRDNTLLMIVRIMGSPPICSVYRPGPVHPTRM
jgi:hypothetical protein